MALLEIDGIHVFYDQIEALKGISVAVEDRQIVTLVGGNGAGKSTTLRAISGLLHPRQGEIRFDGRVLTGMGAHDIAAIGVRHVPEGRRVFGKLTVAENLEMGAFTRNDRAGIAQDREQMMALFPRLRERLKQLAGTLSGGEQQMLAAARALMGRPRVLLMDEPSMGLAPMLVEQVFETIKSINAQGMTILLVEQNAPMALSIADHGYVLESGRVVLEGPGRELLDDERVKRAYLGWSRFPLSRPSRRGGGDGSPRVKVLPRTTRNASLTRREPQACPAIAGSMKCAPTSRSTLPHKQRSRSASGWCRRRTPRPASCRAPACGSLSLSDPGAI